MKRVSLKTIAEQLGVSTATVSLALSGKAKEGRVSEELSNKIVDMAKELNYMPNTLAKGLRIGKSKTIGLVIADISNVFFGTLALHIQEYAEKEGYAIIIVNTNERFDKMEKLMQLLKARQVDGFIITPTENSKELIEDLIAEKLPFVLVDRSFPDLEVNSVLINNYDISYKSTEKLIQQGCRNIGLITYKQNQFHINERGRGYVEALKDAGIFNPENIEEVCYDSLKSDVDSAIYNLINKKDKIDGIFFTTNSISINGVKSLIKNNINVPKEIQIMCFDESEAFYLLPYMVPFVKQPIEQMAEKSMELLIANIKMDKVNIEIKQCIIDAELIIE
ncbi:MAG: LacI family DNA-binding transcriptional regulator [Dysgonamonadaceae bacterium]|nr:LacI family DNA-binding transcriptional regulator [Dysgonamonadaceae bacterium]MDD3355418.1 LacI family DNA-binding transcriptional regulator [Dysgonamonadaceae bacterium]MDD3727211.1 LacI family DNA-binding transcriptional regulator [Dysgonamonadaceae bacterium]MDD4605484.1 LacI family DNA-binding transcriptional regulator [Dysgonamonadaceae bacterium]